jgi:hypothetical protein
MSNLKVNDDKTAEIIENDFILQLCFPKKYNEQKIRVIDDSKDGFVVLNKSGLKAILSLDIAEILMKDLSLIIAHNKMLIKQRKEQKELIEQK